MAIQPSNDPVEDDIIDDDDTVLPGDGEDEAQVEAEARAGGWRPLDEYRGPPGSWIDARAFIERGKNFVPFLRRDLKDSKAANQRLTDEVHGLRTDLDEVKQLARGFRDSAVNAEQRGYERAMAELKAKQREAAAQGDVAAFDQAEAEIAELEADKPVAVAKPNGRAAAPPPPDPQPKPQDNIAPEVKAFAAANPWFTTDRSLNQRMIAEHVRLTEEMPELPLGENLEMAKEIVMAAFPAKFPRRPPADEPPARPREPRRGQVIEPQPPRQTNRQRATGIDAIEDAQERAEAKQAFARQKNLMPEFTEEQFMRLYDNPKADVLEIIRQPKPKPRERQNVR